MTLVAALRIDGLTAPYVVDGAMDGPSFLAYVASAGTNTAQGRHRLHGQSAHPQDRGGAGSDRSRRSSGALFACLLSRSQSHRAGFSKLKMALRKGAARTVTTLLKLIGRLIKTFAPEECANYFRYAGWGVTQIKSKVL
jgi:hypothetical protein